ncbi:MAG: hypothetical protein JSS68_09300 [Actinobacteria bacterium]|nr:hypothetical protein [Actinomycetota bacterium]MBS1882937.1 hypothetical protein [Actinomycetota bacterium]
MTDKELEDEILDCRPRFYAVELISGWAVRDGLTGRLIAIELSESVAESEAQKANEAHA